MFLSKLFKHTRARVITALAGMAMIVGAGASIVATTTLNQNKVVETKASAPYGNNVYLEDYWLYTNPYAYFYSSNDTPSYWGTKMNDTGKNLDWNSTSRRILQVAWESGKYKVRFNDGGSNPCYNGSVGDSAASVDESLNMYIKREDKWVKWDGSTDCWTGGTRTIYFLKGTDWNADWYNVRLHYWNGQISTTWGSTSTMNYVGTDIAGNYIYSMDVAAYINHFIFQSNGRSMRQEPGELAQSSTQTLCDGTDSNAWKSLITYNPNDGEGSETMAAHTAGDGLLDCATLSFSAPDHMHFKEWNTAQDGGGDSYTETESYSGGEIKLYAIWEEDVHTITLDNQSATSAGTGSIYEKYNVGFFLDSAATSKQMTTSANGITVPTKTGYSFGGYYTSTGGSGTQYIDANGKLTSSASATHFDDDGTLYAKWTINNYAVTIAGGTGISSVYLATSSTAASGSASGTNFAYGSTVYGFVVLLDGYAHQDGWTLITGTADRGGAKYRVDSLTVATSGNSFGTIDAIDGEAIAIQLAKDFNSHIGGVCKNDGSTNITTLKSQWDTEKSAYNSAAYYVQYWLTVSVSSDTNVTAMLAKYDWVCGKYGPNGTNQLNAGADYLGRNPQKPAGAAFIPGASTNDQSPLTTTLWVVLGCGLLGLGAIGTAYFVSKKKKRYQA